MAQAYLIARIATINILKTLNNDEHAAYGKYYQPSPMYSILTRPSTEPDRLVDLRQQNEEAAQLIDSLNTRLQGFFYRSMGQA